MSDALKSNTSLTKLCVGGGHKTNNTQMASINNLLFYILIESTGNGIGDRGATSVSDALKSNTTLTKLCVGGEHKETTQMTSINNLLFYILIESTGNDIGYRGATSLSDALKSNTTLTKLDLSGGHKRNNTKGIHQQSTLLPFSPNQQGTRLVTQEEHHWLMH